MTSTRADMEQSDEGQLAQIVVDLLHRRGPQNIPGVWDFWEELRPYVSRMKLRERRLEIETLYTAEALAQGRRLVIHERLRELLAAEKACQEEIDELERHHRGRPPSPPSAGPT
jgi:hypothetical protein